MYVHDKATKNQVIYAFAALPMHSNLSKTKAMQLFIYYDTRSGQTQPKDFCIVQMPIIARRTAQSFSRLAQTRRHQLEQGVIQAFTGKEKNILTFEANRKPDVCFTAIIKKAEGSSSIPVHPVVIVKSSSRLETLNLLATPHIAGLDIGSTDNQGPRITSRTLKTLTPCD